MGKRGPKPIPLSERFWPKVNIIGPDDCWPWTAVTDSSGYGLINEGGWHGKQLGAHRVAWRFAFGPIPNGLQVCHRCDNPGCCNPRHLFLGDQKANMADAISKGRNARGSRNGNAVLTETLVGKIKRLLCSGSMLQRRIAERFRVNERVVSNIALGKRWQHVS